MACATKAALAQIYAEPNAMLDAELRHDQQAHLAPANERPWTGFTSAVACSEHELRGGS